MSLIALEHPIQDELKSFLDSIASENKSSSTRIAYQTDLEQFFETKIITQDQAKSITMEDVESYRNDLISQGRKSTTVNRKLTSLRKFFKRLIAKGIISVNPADTAVVKSMKVEPSVMGKSISREDLEKMIACSLENKNPLKSARDYAMLLIMVYCGLRRAEVANMRWIDLIVEDGYNVLRLPKTKSQVEQFVKIPKRGYDALRNLETAYSNFYDVPTIDGYIFTSMSKHQNFGRQLSVNSIRRIVMGYGKQIGISITPHMFRHSCCTLAIEGGAKPHQVQAHLRHKDIKTTMLYYDAKDKLTDNASDYI